MPGTYPHNWKEIAQKVKDEAGWHCIRCNHEHDPPAGYCLTVHHLDGDKANCEWWNLAALCQRCHLHIQAKVEMSRIYMFEHTEWFVPYVAGYYADKLGLPCEREYVQQHASHIFDLIREAPRGPLRLPNQPAPR